MDGFNVKFSVIVPLYNKEKHIKRAIISVLSQSYSKFELIIVNDGSTDSSLNQVEKIQDQRIIVINQSNQGVSVARNTGILNANYEYIALLDADDKWETNFLSEIKKLIEKYPKAGIYATGYKFVRDNGEIDYPQLNLDNDQVQPMLVDYFKASIVNTLISASSSVIPKDVISKIGLFSTQFKRGEDLEVWCKISLEYEVAFINKVCAIYYQNSENRSNVGRTKLGESFASISDELLIEKISESPNPFYFKEYMTKIIISKAKYLIQENKRAEARKLLFKFKNTKYHKKKLLKTYILTYRLIDLLNRGTKR